LKVSGKKLDPKERIGVYDKEHYNFCGSRSIVRIVKSWQLQ